MCSGNKSVAYSGWSTAMMFVGVIVGRTQVFIIKYDLIGHVKIIRCTKYFQYTRLHPQPTAKNITFHYTIHHRMSPLRLPK